MKNTIALIAVAGLAAAASAQSATLNITPTATEIDTSGGAVTVTINVSATGTNGIDGFDIQVLGNLAGTGGFQLGDTTVNTTNATVNADGVVNTSGNGGGASASVNPFFFSAATEGIDGQLFSFDVTIEAGSLGLLDFSAAEGGFGPAGFLHFFTPNGFVGLQNNYQDITVNGGRINLVPAPSSLALLGLGGLAAARRRR